MTTFKGKDVKLRIDGKEVPEVSLGGSVRVPEPMFTLLEHRNGQPEAKYQCSSCEHVFLVDPVSEENLYFNGTYLYIRCPNCEREEEA